MTGLAERRGLFNNALNTFYLRPSGSHAAGGPEPATGLAEQSVLFNNALNTFYLRPSGSLVAVGREPATGLAEQSVLFNNALNTFYLWPSGSHAASDRPGGTNEVFYLTTHSTHFIYGHRDLTQQWAQSQRQAWRNERSVLFNNALNTFYLRPSGSHVAGGPGPVTGLAERKEMFYLSTLSTHFIYCYMVSGIW